jgi:hypothetical protein
MKLNSKVLGECDVVIRIWDSAVDCYIESGYGEYGFELSEEELEQLQKEFEAEVQAYAWESGLTSNKN